jgi:diacylglycerol kinase family enzyme
MRRAAGLTVEADGPILCHVDGEPHQAGARIAIATLPRALRVRVPAARGTRGA